MLYLGFLGEETVTQVSCVSPGFRPSIIYQLYIYICHGPADQKKRVDQKKHAAAKQEKYICPPWHICGKT